MRHIIELLRSEYALSAPVLSSMPQGADRDSRLWQVRDSAGARWIARLRRGPVNHAALRLPRWMQAQGQPAFIAPRPTLSNALEVLVSDGYLTLLPLIEGHNGFERELNAPAWRQLGRALHRLHHARLPEDLHCALPRERFAAESCAALQRILQQADNSRGDSFLIQLSRLLCERRNELDWLLRQTARLARALRRSELPLVPCHGDVHAGNVLIDDDNRLWLVDFDTLQLAPRERDLMFIGGGVAGHWQSPQECRWFHEGYGPAEPDARAMAFYRCERIIADAVDYCGQVRDAGGERRGEFALAELQRQLAPGPELRIARATVEALRAI